MNNEKKYAKAVAVMYTSVKKLTDSMYFTNTSATINKRLEGSFSTESTYFDRDTPQFPRLIRNVKSLLPISKHQNTGKRK